MENGVETVAVKLGKSCANTNPGAISGTPNNPGRLSRSLPDPSTPRTASSPAKTLTAWNPYSACPATTAPPIMLPTRTGEKPLTKERMPSLSSTARSRAPSTRMGAWHTGHARALFSRSHSSTHCRRQAWWASREHGHGWTQSEMSPSSPASPRQMKHREGAGWAGVGAAISGWVVREGRDGNAGNAARCQGVFVRP